MNPSAIIPPTQRLTTPSNVADTPAPQTTPNTKDHSQPATVALRLQTDGGHTPLPARHQEAAHHVQQLRAQIQNQVPDTRPFVATPPAATLRSEHLASGNSSSARVPDSPLNQAAREIATTVTRALLTGGENVNRLPPELQKTVQRAADTVRALRGDFLTRLDTARHETNRTTSQNQINIIEGFVRQTITRATTHLSSETPATTHAARSLHTTHTASSQASLAIARELVNAVRLAGQFAAMRTQSESVVSRAEAALARFLSAPERHTPEGHTHASRSSSAASPSATSLLTATELMRDLRSGFFIARHDASSPFMLTGRARIAGEMMELMRLLDRIDEFARTRLIHGQSGDANGEFANHEFEGEPIIHVEDLILGGTFDDAAPMLPGRSVETEMPELMRLFATAEGALRDEAGNALLTLRDGTPLKLDELVWLSGAGGVISAGIDGIGVETSPLLLYGFDAAYSLIGFDGRSLKTPAFLLVHKEINNSESVSLYGHQPFTDGWMRAIIERLKDSASVHNNALGQSLEEALAYGQLHQAALRGAMENGAPAPESFSLKSISTGMTAAFA